MGIHGLGEGWGFAGVAAGVSGTTDIVSAFGGWNPVVSYPLRKFFEASIVSIVYTIYVHMAPDLGLTLWDYVVSFDKP